MMTLFAFLGLPVFLVVVYSVTGAPPAGGRRGATGTALMPIPMVEFSKGLVYGVVGAIAGVLLQRFLRISYRPFPMFLYYLVVDYLVAAAMVSVVAGFFYRNKTLLETVFAAGGFYTVVAVGGVLTSYGAYDPYSLFLRPALYMAAVLYLPLFLAGYREWFGFRRALYALAVAAVPVAAAAIALLERRFYEAWAITASVAFFGGSVAVLLYSGER